MRECNANREGDAPAEPKTSFSSASAGGIYKDIKGLRRTPTCGRFRLGGSLALPSHFYRCSFSFLTMTGYDDHVSQMSAFHIRICN